MGKGRTAIRRLHRKHCPNMKDRTHNANLPAGNSTDLRKRVLLKSPVRENRTPGFVLGRSGNWPSYRDGATPLTL